jgi:glutathione S-transferase
MKYSLYYSPGTASMCVHWMLIELGVPFDAHLIDIEAGAQRSPEYLRLNPDGRVPTLVVDGKPYGESAALLMLLAELHPEASLAPTVGSAHRAIWMQNMIFCANTILPAMRDWFYADTDGDGSNPDVIRNLARHRIEAAWDKLDTMLADGREFLIGDKTASQLSTVDFFAVMLTRWSRNMPRPATTWPHIHRYVVSMRNRDSFKTLNSREGLTGWDIE